MKRNYTLLLLLVLFLFSSVSILAQTPEKMSYQAVLRDASNTLLTYQQVGIQISILQTTITGVAVYTETQTATTNINGLVSIAIGSGTSSDDFSAIDWSAGPYFIKTATDASGGSNYSIIGTSQLMSVPFALYAKTAGNDELKENTANKSTDFVTDAASDVKFPSVKSVKTYVDAVLEEFAYEYEIDEFFGNYETLLSYIDEINDEINENETALRGYILALEARIVSLEQSQPIGATIGDLRDGGVVFWVDPADNTHGLVCALQDYQSIVAWGCYNLDIPNVPNVPSNGGNPVGFGAEIGDGDTNTNAILNDCPSAPAALAARSLGPEWFLPSSEELNQMYIHKTTLEAVAGFSAFSNGYWSSTEGDDFSAWLQSFVFGFQSYGGKGSTSNVRAVRAF
jgi:hypothetical protein